MKGPQGALNDRQSRLNESANRLTQMFKDRPDMEDLVIRKIIDPVSHMMVNATPTFFCFVWWVFSITFGCVMF